MSTNQTAQRTGRGRPNKHGEREGFTLAREALILKAFDEARSRGEKYNTAVQEAIQYVRSWRPILPVSSGEVRRVLTRYRGKGAAEGWLFREPAASERGEFQVGEIMRVFEWPYTAQSQSLIVSSGQLPSHQRINAKEKGQ